MSIKAVVVNTAGQNLIHKVVVNDQGGIFSPASPFTVKNEIGENIAIAAVDQLIDVDLVEKVNGATLIWNSSTNKYEVRPLITINGGSF